MGWCSQSFYDEIEAKEKREKDIKSTLKGDGKMVKDKNGFKVFVTVKRKKCDCKFPIWNRVLKSCKGNSENLVDIVRELNLLKDDVNGFVNSEGLALKDVDIFIEWT